MWDVSFLSSTLPIHQLNILKLFENYAFHEKNSRFHYFLQYKISKNKNEKAKKFTAWNLELIGRSSALQFLSRKLPGIFPDLDS